MSNEHTLATAPDGQDPSTRRHVGAPRTSRRFRRLTALVALVAGCSRVAPTATPEETPRPPAGGIVAKESARGPATTPTETAPSSEERADHVAAEPAAPAAVPARNKKASSSLDMAAATGAGLSGVGSGGGGLGMVGLSAPGSGSAQGFGNGHGRLGGSHSTARMAAAATGAPLTIARGPAFDTEAYKRTVDNPFRLAREAPLSTFSVDVDTASYSNMRRFIGEGRRPPEDAIRVEEWINYFRYDDAPPAGGEPIAIASELTECPWSREHRLLRVSLTTAPIAQTAVPPRNLVFLIDVSGSMNSADKLPLLKSGLALLARQLRPVDTLSIVVYAGSSGVALPPTSGADQAKVLATLENLQAGGSTNGAEGIQLAYQLAEQQMKKGGINRVVLATDGDFNVGVTSEGELERLIEQKRKSGVFLTVLGFGRGNLKDSAMEALADKGNGNYAYVDSLAEARKVLVREAGATLVTVAQDVKLQLEFNPTRVKSYRLVGYENRVLSDQDFNDDTKDAGDMGAGHHVTAFYEVVPGGAPEPVEVPGVDPLRYQGERSPTAASATAELVTVKIRYKAPGGARSLLLSRTVADRVVPLEQASVSLRFGAAVAQYGLALRGAPGVGAAEFAAARKLAEGAIGVDRAGERREFLALMDRATRLPM